jgi:hypothetical protein
MAAPFVNLKLECVLYTETKYVIQIQLKIMYKHINRHFLLHLFFIIPSLPVYVTM